MDNKALPRTADLYERPTYKAKDATFYRPGSLDASKLPSRQFDRLKYRKAQASLDAVKDGQNVSEAVIMDALKITGDLK